LVWLLAVLALAIAGLDLFVDSELARSRVRSLIEARASEALGRRVSVGRVDFDLLPLELAVEDVRIASDRQEEPPLAVVAHAEVSIGLGPRREVELRRVEIEGLEVVLQLREDGSDNLPRPRSGGGRGATVRLGGLSIRDSAVTVHEERLPLDVEASAVLARLVSPDGSALDGSVTAQSVVLHLPDARPWRATVSARVRLDGDGLRIVRARVDGPEAHVRTSGTVGWERGTTVELEAHAETSGTWLDERGWLQGEIAGELAFDGRFVWRDRTWSVDGVATSPAVEVVGFALSDLSGSVRVDPDRARLDLEAARWAGGTLAGSLAVGLARPYAADLDVVASGVALDGALARFEVPVRGLRGRLSGPFRYRFDLLDAERGSGSGEFEVGVAELGADRLPVDGHVAVALADGEVHIGPLRWHAAGQTVEGEGDLGLTSGRGAIDLRVSSENLGGLVRLLPFVERDAIWAPSEGTGQLDLRVTLEPGRYAVAGSLAGAAVVAPGVRAARVEGRMRVDATSAVLEGLRLEHRDGGTLGVDGEVPLVEDGALDLTVVAGDWPIEEAAPWLPFELPLAGPARGTLRLGGTLETLTGGADVVVAPVVVGGIEGRRLAAGFEWDAERLRVESAQLDVEAGLVVASGTLGIDDGRLDFELGSQALALDRAPLASVGQGALAGTLELEGRFGGTLDAPSLSVRAAGHHVTLAGRALPEGREPELAFDWRDGVVASTVDLPGVLHLTGGGALRLGESARLEFDVESERLADLVAVATGGQRFELDGGVHAALAVEVDPEGAVSARLEARELAFRWQEREIHNLEPVVASLEGGTIRIESLYLAAAGGGTDELFVGGGVELGDPGRLDLHLQADLGAEWLRPLVADLEISGRISVLANLRGSLDHPALTGQGSLSQGRWIPPIVPHALEQARALVLFYPDAVVLDELTGSLAGGRVQASGRLSLPADGPPTYQLELSGRDLAPRWPVGWQLRGETDLTLTSTDEGRLVTGQVQLDRAYYVQDLQLSPAQLVQRLLSRSRLVLPETDELLSSTALNIAISAPGSFRVRNNLAELDASADLSVRGSLARPVLFGDVRTEEGGKVFYAGNTYEVERGVVTFANPARIDPYLDIVTRTRIEDYAVTLNIAGALSRPITAFSSDPPLPDLEILGLLATGAPVESALVTDVSSGDASGSRSVAAEALLYGQAASLVSQRVGKLFGFDRVRIEPLTSEDTVASARVTVGKRLSNRIFVTYSYDPASTAQDIFQVEWRLSPKLILVLTQNGDESYAVDARWENRF